MADGTWTLLEDRVRLSESVLYEIQNSFYNRVGLGAWNTRENAIPSYATCNTYIAKWYAEIVLAHLREGVRTGAIDPAQPVYIVELGAGAGEFAFYFLRKLGALREASSVRHLDVRYVMTDASATNVDAWTRHPYLAPLAERGVLDFGTFDINRDTRVTLVDGTPLSTVNPLVVFANYVLDSVRHDLMKVDSHELVQVRLSTRVRGAVRPPLDQPGLFEQVRIQYSQAPAVPSELYADPDLAAVVDEYRSYGNTTIAIPVGAFAGLAALLAISKNRLLMIASDKGHTMPDELYDPMPAHLTMHNGCFSMMVNFDSMRRYIERRGGFYRATPLRMSLKTAVLLIGGTRDEHADTLGTIEDRLSVAPGDFFEHLIDRTNDPTTFASILRLVRQSGHDPRVLGGQCHKLTQLAPTLTNAQRIELRDVLEQTWPSFFPGLFDLALELSRVMLALDWWRDALDLLEISTRQFGEHPRTLLELSLLCYAAKDLARARAYVARALELDPSLDGAVQWEAKLRDEQEASRRTA